jgi:hypothetical protein
MMRMEKKMRRMGRMEMWISVDCNHGGCMSAFKMKRP